MAIAFASPKAQLNNVSLPRPSLRQRLFSSASRKATRQPKGTQHSPAPEINHPAENSASTSSSETVAPPTASEEEQTSQDLPQASLEPLSTSEDVIPPAVLRTQVDDPDREQGSFNATLSAQSRRVPFYRRRNVNRSSNSQAGASSHSIVKPSSSRSTRPKPSLFSRVVYRVVPCVLPDPEILTTEAQNDEEQDGYMQLQELPPVQTTERSNAMDGHPESSSRNSDSSPLQTPPSPTDSEIIVSPPPSAQLLPEEETDGLTSGAVQPPGSTGELIIRNLHDGAEDSDASFTDDEERERRILNEQEEEERLIKNGGTGIPIGSDGQPQPLLPPIAPEYVGRKCLVLDLDETLVHSSFKALPSADFVVPVEIEYHWHHFHVLKRPGVDHFLKKMGELFEIVVFTASLSKYADPVLDKLDIHQVVAHRLFRESCYSHRGNYVKDLSQLGRPISDTIILDNSPASYIFHPTNAVPVSSWFNDPHDAELTDLIPFLADLTSVPDVRSILDGGR